MSNTTNLIISTRVHLTKKWDREIDWKLKADLFEAFHTQVNAMMDTLKREITESVIADKKSELKEESICHEKIPQQSLEIAEELQHKIHQKLIGQLLTVTTSRTITQSNKDTLNTS
jgi:hypothetical protein